MNKEAKISYLGKIRINRNIYEIIEDETNNIINVFYKNFEEKEVECFSLQKTEVEKSFGKDILSKTETYWVNLLHMGKKKIESLVFFQVFPLEMWTDIILPIKNGHESDIKFESVVPES